MLENSDFRIGFSLKHMMSSTFALKFASVGITAHMGTQGRNHGKNLGATCAMVGRICPPGCNRVKVSQIIGAHGMR